MNELLSRAQLFASRIAVVDAAGEHTYADLLRRSDEVAAALRDTLDAKAGRAGSAAPTVAYLLAPGFEHVAVQWGIWRAGAIGVPLSAAQAAAEWRYVLEDAEAAAVIVDSPLLDAMRACVHDSDTVAVVTPEALAGRGKRDTFHFSLAPQEMESVTFSYGDGLILYTSGTTGKPKGVVLTHANIEAQVRCLVDAWQWRADDRILLVLPLHHVHGIVNVLTCALWSGATCEIASPFDASDTWRVLASGRLTLFMAVPTIYSKLIAAWNSAPADAQEGLSAGCRAMRLMVSGSAALSAAVLNRWRQITGHVLLERYGMTEIGMALSNPLQGERRPGFVGMPLPGVAVRIVDEHGRMVETGTPGELEVRGPGVFREYWHRPDATAGAFRDGWFRTGDVAVEERGMYRLLGRQSVDIIKSGGYKVSALEIEEALREHPAIAECAVVGLEDSEWGERIAVAVVLRGETPLSLDELRVWAGGRVARYKLPTRLAVVEDLPRNAMGKVSKPAVKLVFA